MFFCVNRYTLIFSKLSYIFDTPIRKTCPMAAIRSIVRFSQQNFLVLVIFLAFFARFTATFIVGSTELEHEYAPLVLNMTAGRGFVFYSVDQSNKLTTEFLANPKLLIPSAFKSPVYPFFLLKKLSGDAPSATAFNAGI